MTASSASRSRTRGCSAAPTAVLIAADTTPRLRVGVRVAAGGRSPHRGAASRTRGCRPRTKSGGGRPGASGQPALHPDGHVDHASRASSHDLSYAHGPSDVPLLGETIGENLRRTVERFGDREALVVAPPGLPRDLRRAVGAVDRAARAPARARRAEGRPRRHLVAQPLRVGRPAVRHGAHRRDPGQRSTRPTSAAELEYALRQAGRRACSCCARGFRQRRLRRRCSPRSARAARSCARRSCSTTTGRPSWPTASAIDRRELAAREAALQFDDPINIQYTSGTTGSPKGATLSHHNILNNALLRSAGRWATREHDRVCVPVPLLPLLRHGAGQPRAASTHGACMVVPGEAFDPPRSWRPSRPSAARRCTACRRCSSPSSSTRASSEFDLSSLRTGIMAGAPCPVEVMRQVPTRMHMREVDDRLRHDRDLAGLDADRARRPARQARRAPSAACTRTSRSRSSTPRPARIVPRGTPGELCTRGYSVMLGYWNNPEATARGDRRGRLDAHRRPGDDGRRRLRQHRRPDQGHDHPRRREHLPARDRGVPAHPSRASARCR